MLDYKVWPAINLLSLMICHSVPLWQKVLVNDIHFNAKFDEFVLTVMSYLKSNPQIKNMKRTYGECFFHAG